jgi:hypothetical protein
MILLYVIYRFVWNVIRFPLKLLFKGETINEPLVYFSFYCNIYNRNKYTRIFKMERTDKMSPEELTYHEELKKA